jgi:Ca2+-transporting ATPase
MLTFALQLALGYMPVMQDVFSTAALSARDLAIGLAASSIVFWSVELEKWMLRRRPGRRRAPPAASRSRQPATKG